MARGSLRAATQNAYRGAAGATRQAAVHVTLPTGEIASVPVYTAVDVVADPELGQRLLGDDPARALNTLRTPDGGTLVVSTPVVYHDPSNELMALVLAETDRHRELAERARLLAEMAADPTTPVPRYAREFQVVFGARGLRAFLEEKAEKAVAAGRAAEAERELDRERALAERRRAEAAAQASELERLRVEVERRGHELERRTAELDLVRADLERATQEIAQLRVELERRAREAARPVPAAVARLRTAPPAVEPRDEAPTGPFDLGEPDQDKIPTATQPALDARDEPTSITPPPELPPGADPVSTTVAEAAPDGNDGWLAPVVQGAAPHALAVDDGGVRLALRAPAGLARGPLDLRLQLHRTASYPAVTLTVGTPAALRGVAGAEGLRATAILDVAAELDRRALAALSKRFALTVELVADGRRLRRAVLTAPLEENVAYVTRAAQDHLRGVAAEGQPSPARARQELAAPGFDLLGAQHPEASEFRDDKLGQLATAQQLRRALAIARRFSRPAREDYLVTTRGYPLRLWHARRREVLARAVEWGVWMGPELAQAAVSEGLARSRKDLVTRLLAAFEAMVADAAVNDLDGDAADDNRKALAEEAKALGIAGTNGARTAEDGVVASGTIDAGRPAARLETRGRSVEELIALLDDRAQRVAAALELCERADPRAIRPVLHAVRRMQRTEAVRVLGAVVKFGEAAAPALTAGLGSSKAFLRHGCALALGMLRTEAGTEAVIDLLLAEPTEIWRELARAVGQIGPSALMPLAARMGQIGAGASPAERERVAWAMAHIGVRGGKGAVETLAGGASVVAPIARHALELMAPAARDDLRGTGPGREVTVNRAFSRKFFEALGQGGLAAAASAELEALDASGPMELLDEADLIDVDGMADADDEAELDESDLIET